MKFQFKVQPYQTVAVDATVDCLLGQPRDPGVAYRIDPGQRAEPGVATLDLVIPADSGLRNSEIKLPPEQILENIRAVQRRQNLPESKALASSKAARAGVPNLDIEMETGTGKTYVYIKTIMEMNKRYGWSKFIVVVPSIAIREGVRKSFEITAEHFQHAYGTKPRTFIYNSSRLQELERFSSDAGVQVMIINIQAFNSSGKDNRRIFGAQRVNARGETQLVGLDDFGSRKPIDVIAANRPIVVIDEPQKIGSANALESLASFDPLMVLRYSATHKVEHNKVHRLDAVDAYRERLVKRIEVRGITVKGLAGSTAYLYLDGIEVSASAKPRARVEMEIQTKTGIKRQVRRLDQGSNLHDVSGGIEAYKPDGRALIVNNIDATRDIVELSNGSIVSVGQVTEDVTEDAKRRIQIREVIRAHLDKERELFGIGVKVLSLFFIDAVIKYRDYSREDTLGEYARVFEEEYEALMGEHLEQLDLEPASEAYRAHLESIEARKTHQGYFSIDKKTERDVDGDIKKAGEEKGTSTDVDAYDLILKNKEQLLSFSEPVRFLFSHSALREGWDNPNVFVMGMLKKSDNTVSRRQEIGRGLRISVDQRGERMDNPATVHEINELTVVTDESYTDFVAGLQKEIAESLSSRPRKASVKYFAGKTYIGPEGESVVDDALAGALYKYLVKNDYINDDDTISDAYQAARDADSLAVPTSEVLLLVIDQVIPLVDALYLNLDMFPDGRKPKRIPLNEENFAKKEFQELWGRVNHKVVYQVEFDSNELIAKCVAELDKHLAVAGMQYVVQAGQQRDSLDADDLAHGEGFSVTSTTTTAETISASSQVKYDLLGEIAEKTTLTRKTCAAILMGMRPDTFGKFRQNPEQFITEASRLVNEQKATAVIEHLTYDALDDHFETAIFTDGQTKQDFAKAGEKLKRHIYDYVVTDSKVERAFVEALDTSSEVVVYAKLPRGFFIPTPVGDYNPDWAIAFKEGSVKHVYFVAETKGSLSTLQLKGVENSKIECARRFFEMLNEKGTGGVVYDVVTDYGELMELVNS